MTEQWKDVPTWDGIFQVSNYGRLKRIYKSRETILKCSKNKRGYYTIVLQYKQRRQFWLLHRLVATTWFRDLKKEEVAHHKNKIIICNCIWNLQIMNHSQHSFEHNFGTKKSQQTRQKNSLSHKGQIPWNKGKPCSQQTKKKISESNKRRKHLKEIITKEK